MKRRIVVTGLGILAPNAHGLEDYEKALRAGTSGIRFIPRMQELGFACQVGGIPQGVEELKNRYFDEESLLAMNESMIYAGIAAVDAWKDAGLPVAPADGEPDWDAGAVIGTGATGMDTIASVIPRVDAGKVRRLGSTIVEQTMASATSAKLSGLLALGNQVTTNSSACTTGTEAIIMACERIEVGLAERMVAGGADGASLYSWAGFDSMRVLNSSSNAEPQKASRPMSASAAGFIPGSGAGFLLVESLESAEKRGARIYAEILGGALNCGGHRQGGSMTAPNPVGVQRCVKAALERSRIQAADITAINGHLTATFADPVEINNWSRALDRGPDAFPLVNSTKSMIGHGLGAAGGLECVAAVLQIYKGFLHPSINCEDLHPEILPYAGSIVQKAMELDVEILAKSSFGFGDVNGCLIFKRWR
ncbi:MAG: beta-ketoacyl-[acyl-carrier-protein] synthase family protein [Spirochaetales bacterium]|nr:beta-ketoacyl-[acyl-carrier-protein] synthase family protein [Spirochaetales bacterium]